MNRKKIVIAGSVILVLVSLLYIFSNLKSDNLEGLPPSINIPQIVSTKNVNLNISAYTEKDFQFPKSLPFLIFTQGDKLPEEKQLKIASNLGYASEPTQFEDVYDGPILIWTNQTSTLIARSRKNRIDYSTFGITPTSKREKVETLAQIAKNFLVKNEFISSNEVGDYFLTFTDTQQDEPHGAKVTNSYTNADQVTVHFAYKVSEYQIFTGSGVHSIISVSLYPDGKILSAGVTYLGEINKGPKEYNLKDYNEFTKTISLAKIVNILNGEEVDINKNPLESVDIDNVKLVYLLDSQVSELMQPAFLIEGKAKFKNIGEKYDTYLYLPAVSNPAQIP